MKNLKCYELADGFYFLIFNRKKGGWKVKNPFSINGKVSFLSKRKTGKLISFSKIPTEIKAFAKDINEKHKIK